MINSLMLSKDRTIISIFGCFQCACGKVKVKLLSRVRLFATPWTVAHQAPPSMGFSRQEYWSGGRDGLNTSQLSTRNHSNSAWRSSRYSHFTPGSCTLSSAGSGYEAKSCCPNGFCYLSSRLAAFHCDLWVEWFLRTQYFGATNVSGLVIVGNSFLFLPPPILRCCKWFVWEPRGFHSRDFRQSSRRKCSFPGAGDRF